MRLEARRLLDQFLVSETPCLGAVFCSYTFDPAYFEDHVLRALLWLQGDPEEDAVRYHEEARSALRETPVACFIDANVRRGGRRLPYDLQLVRSNTFHPKVILVLYEGEARIAVGSGNTTRAGFEQNAELFFTRTLRYDSPGDAALLRSVDTFLEGCARVATHRGTQLGLVRSALAARLASTPAPAPGDPSDISFVHTFQASMLDALAEVIPQDARLRRVGVLSPFFEQDDMGAAHDLEGLSSVLAALLQLRAAESPTFDIGVPWEDAPLASPSSGSPPSLEAGTGRLWARRWQESVEGGKAERLAYLVVDRVTAKRVEARDSAGQSCRYERELLEAEIAEGRFWPVATPTVHAPKRILERIAAEYPAQLWLHPTATLSPSGRASRRQLHAKLLLVTVTRRGKTWTYGLAGSANASRAALSRAVAQGSNVEAGILFCLEGEVFLHDFLPTLVNHPIGSVQLEEREQPVAEVDFSAWIDDVVHDAAARTLTVHWSEQGGPPGLGAWEWRYLEKPLKRGEGPGSGAVVLSDFELAAASAELEFRAGGRHWLLPIRVADLAVLPSNPHLVGLGVRELLALLGRRVGPERLATLREQRGPPGVATVLDAVFGEGFGPTDVFKAWWGLREDLDAAPTVAAFRYRLLGPTGARAAWAGLRELPGEQVSGDEVWVYGCELLRELRQVVLPEGPDRAAKQELLAEFLTSLRSDLAQRVPPGREHPWIQAVTRFYGLEESHGDT